MATSGFSGLYGQDAYAYYDYATGPLRESLSRFDLFPPFAWPPGYPLLVALLSFLTGTAPTAGQLLSWVAGGMVPIFTALLATEIEAFRNKRQFALLAGVFVALNGQLWQSSIVLMSDTISLAAGTLGMVALARYGNRPLGRWLVLATGGLAFAVITRLAYWLVAIPAGIYALILLMRQPLRRVLRHAFLAAATAAIILVPVLWSTVSSLLAPQSEFLVFARAGEIYEWSPLTALSRVHVTADGILSYRLPNGLYYAAAPARPIYFSPLIAIFIVPGLWSLLHRRARMDLLLLVGWAGSVYLFHAGTAWQNFRFTLVYLPPLAILAALGAAEVVAYIRKRFSGQKWLFGLMALWLLAGLSWATVGAYRLTHDFINMMLANVETVHWVEEQVPPKAHLVSFSLALTLEHESNLETHHLYFLTPEQLNALLNDEQPVYLLIDVDSVETQWAGRTPAENYHWLRDGPGLTEIGRRQQYTLFAVNEGEQE